VQNFRDIHIVGVFSIFLSLAFPISPIIFSVSAISIMIAYIRFFYKYVYLESSIPDNKSSTDIIVKTKIPKGYYVFLMRIFLVLVAVIYLLLYKEFGYSLMLTSNLIIAFCVIQFFAFSILKENNTFYYCVGSDSVESNLDYTNRIYFNDLKEIKTNNNFDNYNFISGNGNQIKIDLKHYPKEFQSEVANKVREISQKHNIEFNITL
jgi:hypothetical protein